MHNKLICIIYSTDIGVRGGGEEVKSAPELFQNFSARLVRSDVSKVPYIKALGV